MSEGSFLTDVEPTIEDSALSELSELCSRQQILEIELKSMEEAIAEKKKTLENVSRNLIPSLLSSYGLSEIRLSSGEKVVISEKLKASIADKNYMLAYRNMVNEEGGDEHAVEKIESLFKSQVILSDTSEEVLDLLLDNNIAYDSKKSIHPQTLIKYCRERIEGGKVIPEGISVFQYQETKITK